MKRKRTPEERERYARLRAKWDAEQREFDALYVRLRERWREEDARRERRRRLLPFVG
jgi:hypothetical protein